MAERHDLYMWEGIQGTPAEVHHMDGSSGHLGNMRCSPSEMDLVKRSAHEETIRRYSQLNPRPHDLSHPGHMYGSPPVTSSGHPLHNTHNNHPLNSVSGPNTPLPPVQKAPTPLVVPQPIKTTKGPKTYNCKMCDQIFDSKNDLLVHSQHVHKQDPKPYKCPTCSKSFANSSYLSQHARIHAGIKPYKCTICDRKFTQLCHLQQHMRTHTGEKPYKCQAPGCGKSFSQLSNLQSHSRSHMTDKPYRCNSCYKCFADEQGLREHIPKHSETKHLKTNICHVCGKSYTQETYLTRHMTKHQYDSSGRAQNMKQQHQQHQQHPQQQQLSPNTAVDVSPHHHHSEPPNSKAPSDGLGLIDNAKHSAFMPLSAHQLPSQNMMNSSVPSSFGFPPARIPSSVYSSPLPHISSVSSSRPYFFDTIPKRDIDSMYLKREPIEPQALGNRGKDGMAVANSLLSLQQIKSYQQSFSSKSEPSSPVQKDFL